MIKQIACIDRNGGIGDGNGNLLCRIGADMKRFREITYGSSLLMGRLTFESIGSRGLDGRFISIVSSLRSEGNGYKSFSNIYDAFDYAYGESSSGDIFVCGGSSVYKDTMRYSEELYVTEVDCVFNNAKVFYPIEMLKDYNLISSTPGFDEESGLNYSFKVYRRK